MDDKYSEEIMDKINVAAYFIAKGNHPYDALCWMFAERELCKELRCDEVPDEIISPKAAQVYFSRCDYDVLCWLIAEHDILRDWEL